MDRRTYTFIVASAAFLFFYLSLRAVVAPPGQNPDEVAENAAEVVEDEVAIDANDPPGEEGEVDGIESTSGDAKWYTLGSMDPAAKQNLLVTFSSQGGAVERIELTARDSDGSLAYRRVDTRSGYLGYFAGESSSTVDGMRVNVVGPGTPAATAVAASGEKGIQVGDIVLAVRGTPVLSDNDIHAALAESKPGDVVTVEVARGAAADAVSNPLLFEATLTQHPLDLVRLASVGGDDQVDGNISRLSSLMTVAQMGTKRIATGKRSLPGFGDPGARLWEGSVDAGDDGTQTIHFETTIGSKVTQAIGGQPVKLKRSFTIRPGSFVIDMQMEIVNLGSEPQNLAYRLEGPNGVTAEGWWYSNKISPNWFKGAAARDVVYNTAADGHQLISGMTLLKDTRSTPEDPNYGIFAGDGSDAAQDLKYIGIDSQYFAVAYLPVDDASRVGDFERASATVVADTGDNGIPKHQERAVNVSFFLNSTPTSIPAGESLSQSLRMYAGPKEPQLLDSYGIGRFVYYGWFSLFSKLLSALLHFLQSVVGNYAIAIVLLTVIVRGCMFPISRNAAVNAQRMQELAPEMKKIAEKYKDDMEGRLKAQQALQKRVGFNPLAGCLPMFLQLPIFMGLYRALSVDIDLRQKPLGSPSGWASNLAAPDQFLFWADWMPEYFSGRGTGWLGPYFNLLPIIVVALFLTQQKLFMPPATDEQTAMTQKVMTVMTLFMGLFFFRVPAGLCIYFTASSLWGIGERLIVKKTLPQGKHFNLDEEGDVIDAVSASPTGGKKTITEKLLEQMNPKTPEQPVERPSKRKRPPNKKKKR